MKDWYIKISKTELAKLVSRGKGRGMILIQVLSSNECLVQITGTDLIVPARA